MSDSWTQLHSLKRGEIALLAKSCVLLPLVDLSLRIVGLGRTRRALASLIRPRPCAVADIDAIAETTSRIVRIAATRSLWRVTCLRQALVLWWLLAQRGVDTQIRLGVAKDPGQAVESHAWVERNGVVLIGGDISQERFRVLL